MYSVQSCRSGQGTFTHLRLHTHLPRGLPGRSPSMDASDNQTSNSDRGNSTSDARASVRTVVTTVRGLMAQSLGGSCGTECRQWRVHQKQLGRDPGPESPAGGAESGGSIRNSPWGLLGRDSGPSRVSWGLCRVSGPGSLAQHSDLGGTSAGLSPGEALPTLKSMETPLRSARPTKLYGIKVSQNGVIYPGTKDCTPICRADCPAELSGTPGRPLPTHKSME
jgi:hypothetical protein